MRIIISDHGDGQVTVTFEDTLGKSSATFGEIYPRLMCALEGAVTKLLNETPVPDVQQFRAHMYDVIDDGFANLLAKVFPEIDVGKFDLTAAAIVYAQDQIIEKAEREGKSYNEMLDEYEKIADRYIAEKRLH